MTSKTVEELRESYKVYFKVRQKRYDELSSMMGNGHKLIIHDRIVKILEDEEQGNYEFLGFSFD